MLAMLAMLAPGSILVALVVLSLPASRGGSSSAAAACFPGSRLCGGPTCSTAAKPAQYRSAAHTQPATA